MNHLNNFTCSFARIFTLLVLIAGLSFSATAQQLERIANIAGVGDSSIDWADYDGDGDLDLLIAGQSYADVITRLFKNNNGIFEEVPNTPFIGIYLGEVAWGDFDNDGDPDLIITGLMGNGNPTTQMYRNDNGTFVDMNAGITALQASMVDWGDYDQDGDLDFFIAGADVNSQSVTKIYRNNGSGSFTDIGANLKGLRRGDGQWFQISSNKALMISGRDTNDKRHTLVYEYINGAFQEVDYEVPDVDLSAFTISENLSSQKVLIAGTSDTGSIARVYDDPDSNDAFPNLIGSWDGVEFASADWAPNADNFKQFVVMGRNSDIETVTRVYSATSDFDFEEVGTSIRGLHKGSVKWGDFDGDGDDDLAIAGYDASDYQWTEIYENVAVPDVTPPQSPRNIWVEKSNSTITLNWTNGLDASNNIEGLTYEVRVGTAPGAKNIISPPDSGPADLGDVLKLDISHLNDGTYYWSARTVGASNARSPYATEQIFYIGADDFSAVSTPFAAEARKGVWADIDNDEDLDVILTGHRTEGQTIAKVYKNQGGIFTDANANLAGIYRGASELSDIDNDGDLDMLIHGEVTKDDDGVTQLYLNNNGVFTATSTNFGTLKKYEGLVPAGFESVRFADIDNDGDEDLVFSAGVGMRVIQNIGGVFSDEVENRDGFYLNGDLTVADYDNDQDIDLVLTGLETHAYKNPTSWIYENQEGFFTIGPDITGLAFGTPAWGDIDNDGDLDLINSGRSTDVSHASIVQQDLTTIYRNDGNIFTLEQLLLAYYKTDSRSSWGDYDADGDLDLLITGSEASPFYENRNGTFVNIVEAFDGFDAKFANWGDYDNDGDLDVLLIGEDHAGNAITKLYKNNIGPKNDEPSVPSNLTTTINNHAVSFSWNAGNDEETGASGLSYNLRVGTTAGSGDILSAPARADGSLLTPALGKVYQSKGWKLEGLDDGTYYWSVQSVDGGFAGSPFAATQSFTIDTGIDPPPSASTFTLVATDDLFDMGNADLTWGDYNGDGDLDILATGCISYADNGDCAADGFATRIVRNTHYDTFQTLDVGLMNVSDGETAWGDYDNDGDLDIALTGRGTNFTSVSRIYRNDGGSTFTDIGAPLVNVRFSSVAWADYDEDGDLDVIFAGRTASGNRETHLYRNDGGDTFVASGIDLLGIDIGTLAWGDYDNDSDLDLFMSGVSDTGIEQRLYRNEAGEDFTMYSGGGIEPLEWSSAAWGDYDADGFLELAIMGVTDSGATVTRIYRLDGTNQFTSINNEVLGARKGELAWADYDNDGDLDLAVTGESGSTQITNVYQNEDGFLSLVSQEKGMKECALAWGDYDFDDDLDLITAGQTDEGFSMRLYKNNATVENTEPTRPEDTSLQFNTDGSVTFNWGASSDEETPVDGLTYNLRVGTTVLSSEIVSPMSLEYGGRLIAAMGNVQHNLSWTINNLPAGTYNWSVQAIDGSFLDSKFSHVQEFTVGGPPPPPPSGDVAFTNSGINLPGFKDGAASWGDYDNDHDLDLLVTGNVNGVRITKLYKNTDGTLIDSGIELPGLDLSAVSWGDFDNDGYLDIAMNGRDARSKFKTFLFRNTGGAFEEVNAGLPGLIAGAIDWGDADNDGDLDLLMTGRLSNLNNYAAVFENDNGVFLNKNAGLTGIRRGESRWIDFDVDGDMDIMLTGRIDDVINRRTLLYKNDGGQFSLHHNTLPDVDLSSIDWGDFDHDGDPDLLLTGTTGSTKIARIYENKTTYFSNVKAGLEPVDFSSARWADFDNNGELDVLLTGDKGGSRIAKLYTNTAGAFGALDVDLVAVSKGAGAWGDFDADGDLDLFVMGEITNIDNSAELYINHANLSNNRPEAPTGLNSVVSDGAATLTWQSGTDTETPAIGLTYNLRIGTTPGGNEVMSASASSDGRLLAAEAGNVGQRLSWDISGLAADTYHWSVQSIDHGFAGSEFSTEASFIITNAAAALNPLDDEVSLSNYPNPFNPTTEIRYALHTPSRVELRVFDMTGKEVATLVNSHQEAGQQRVLFDASHLASGIYMTVLKTESGLVTEKIVLLK